MITVIKLGVNDGDGNGARCGGIEVRIQHVQRFLPRDAMLARY